MHTTIIATPCGRLKLIASDVALLSCQWTSSRASKESPSSPILKKAILQLTAYFSGKLHIFDLPINPEGTPFQKKVWLTLQRVPYGNTASYQDIANYIRHPNAHRAVGSANGKNPLCVIIPCHRVIQKTGALGGYSGGIRYKKALLDLEKKHGG